MLSCVCGGTEFRAMQNVSLGVIVAVDHHGRTEHLREDSPDGVRPAFVACKEPVHLTCLGCGRFYPSAPDVLTASRKALPVRRRLVAPSAEGPTAI